MKIFRVKPARRAMYSGLVLSGLILLASCKAPRAASYACVAGGQVQFEMGAASYQIPQAADPRVWTKPYSPERVFPVCGDGQISDGLIVDGFAIQKGRLAVLALPGAQDVAAVTNELQITMGRIAYYPNATNQVEVDGIIRRNGNRQVDIFPDYREGAEGYILTCHTGGSGTFTDSVCSLNVMVEIDRSARIMFLADGILDAEGRDIQIDRVENLVNAIRSLHGSLALRMLR